MFIESLSKTHKSAVVLLDLGSTRQRPNDPTDPVFALRHGRLRSSSQVPLQRASAALKVADVAAPHLDELDQLTIREVGGWKTLTMVQRYAHLAPGHLHAAVERLVALRQEGAVEPARN